MRRRRRLVEISAIVLTNLDSRQPSTAKVRSQVEHGGGVMPSFKDKLTAAQIGAVANFVASSAGH